MSRLQLAKKAQTTDATVSNWLNDRVAVEQVKAAMLLRFAAAVEASPDWLLFGNSRAAGFRISEKLPDQPSQAVKSETLKIALQLVAETLDKKGLALPLPKRAELTALVYDLLEEGMPEAKVLRFARAAAA